MGFPKQARWALGPEVQIITLVHHNLALPELIAQEARHRARTARRVDQPSAVAAEGGKLLLLQP